MDSPIAAKRSGRSSSYERLLVIIFAIVAVISPLYIDRRSASELEDEEEESSFNLAFLLPVLLLVVILAISVSCYLDQSRFDPYWIHRVGGSSGGIILILTILLLVLKYKSWSYFLIQGRGFILFLSLLFPSSLYFISGQKLLVFLWFVSVFSTAWFNELLLLLAAGFTL